MSLSNTLISKEERGVAQPAFCEADEVQAKCSVPTAERQAVAKCSLPPQHTGSTKLSWATYS